jgi:hypothetical protein
MTLRKYVMKFETWHRDVSYIIPSFIFYMKYYLMQLESVVAEISDKWIE